MTKDVTKQIQNIVNSITNEINGVYDPLTERTNVCSTKWLRVGKKVIDATLNEFVVTEIEPGEWIKAKNENDPTLFLDGMFTIPEPYFLAGTKLTANREWTLPTNDVTQKTPIVWLLDAIRYRKFGRENPTDFETDLRVFFLDETDIVNFYTMDHRTNVVEPMTELINDFLNVINANVQFKPILEFDLITFSRFGVEVENGMFENILDANLSGVELRFTLSKFKENCKNCNNY
jgi:hypothetical protein